MASLVTEKSGLRRIQFLAGKRRLTVSLGAVPEKLALACKGKIEDILSARAMNLPLDPSTASWVAGLSDEFHAKLAAAGLVTPRVEVSKPVVTLADAIDNYIGSKVDAKPNTIRANQICLRLVSSSLGASTPIDQIREEAVVGAIRQWREEGRSPAYIAKALKIFKALLARCVRRGEIERNPMIDIKPGAQKNPDRLFYVPGEWIERVIEVVPTAQWRALMALARWGGVRVPSEPRELKWGHVNWDRREILVPCPKLAHHAGKGERLVPMFPQLAKHLEELFDLAEEGEELVFPMFRHRSTNVAEQLGRYIRRAGLEPWPRCWNNLRASRATELADEFPAHVVASWMGHTEVIARNHYLQVRDVHFQRAIQGTPKGEEATPAPCAKSGADSPECVQNRE